MENRELKSIREAAENDLPISGELALYVLRSHAADLPQIFAAASTVRYRYFGNSVRLCSILNAQSGACSEDCAFCAQASCHNTEIETTPLCSKEGMAQAFDAAAELPVTHFGVVTSGCALSENGVERVCSAVRREQTFARELVRLARVPGLRSTVRIEGVGAEEISSQPGERAELFPANLHHT